MLKGLSLTPPVIGRISIGKVVERNGKRLPEKDDEFTLTSQIQDKDGWIPHPLDKTLRQTQNQGQGANAKLRAIPIRLLFDDPDLSLRAAYSLFDRKTGRPLCVGDGQSCRRATVEGIKALPCPSPDGCDMAAGQCKPLGRLNVRIGDEDELGSFIFRTTGFNSIRTLATRLRYFHAISGGRLSTLPLELRLRGRSTTQSHRAPIFYVDLTTRTGSSLEAAVAAAKEEWERRALTGFDQAALDAAARDGLAHGAFEESVDEGPDVTAEFYPEPTELESSNRSSVATPSNASSTRREPLAAKLSRRTEALKAGGEPTEPMGGHT